MSSPVRVRYYNSATVAFQTRRKHVSKEQADNGVTTSVNVASETRPATSCTWPEARRHCTIQKA
jgi:hypothetical protein